MDPDQTLRRRLGPQRHQILSLANLIEALSLAVREGEDARTVRESFATSRCQAPTLPQNF